MRLKSLLLGTSAAMFVGGASITTAQAADPNPAGLVVTTMANYVEQCNNGNGWKKKDWCITLAGNLVWESSVGNTITYGAHSGVSTLNPVGTEFSIYGQPLSYFGLTSTLTVSVSKPTDAGNLTLLFPVLGSGNPSLTIGPWQFTANQVRYRNTFGPATITATLAEPGRLGWNDPRGVAFNNDWNGPWPDFALDVALDVGAAEIEAGMNIGQRNNNNALAVGEVLNSPFITLGGYVQGEFGAGPADMTVRFDWDRVNAANDGTAAPVFAFGVTAMADIEFGNFTITPSFGWSRNYGYYGFKYSQHELGNYLMAGIKAAIDVGDTLTVNAGATYTRGPNAPADAVLEITGGVRFEPAGASPLYVELDAAWARQLGGAALDALRLRLRVGAAF